VSDFEPGLLVRHDTLGLGKVVAAEPSAVHVFFADGERQAAAKLRLPAARAFLRVELAGQDVRLEGLPAFALDPTTGRYAPAAPPRATKTRKAKK